MNSEDKPRSLMIDVTFAGYLGICQDEGSTDRFMRAFFQSCRKSD